MNSSKTEPFRILSVVASQTAGGIGPVCRYAAEGVAESTDWEVTLLSLHDPASSQIDEETGLRIVCLGLDRDCPRRFLDWLNCNPQDLIITSDVSRIEPAFAHIPESTRHIMQIHDSGPRYRSVAVRHAGWIEGVTCVGSHIEEPLRKGLSAAGFKGVLRTIHNGAAFPPPRRREIRSGPLRLLFMGRIEALKGVFDLVPLLQRLQSKEVPVILNLVGGENQCLFDELEVKGLSHMVNWCGRVPHEQCYEFAANSDLFLMLSRKEPFGMVTIEAMSMGCVPIAYDIPSGSTEIIEHEKNGLLVPLGDIKRIASYIHHLADDESFRSRLSQAAEVRAREVFSARKMADGLIDFVEDVVESSSQKGTSARLPGFPSTFEGSGPVKPKGYQRLSPKTREWIRNFVGRRPRLGYLCARYF